MSDALCPCPGLVINPSAGRHCVLEDGVCECGCAGGFHDSDGKCVVMLAPNGHHWVPAKSELYHPPWTEADRDKAMNLLAALFEERALRTAIQKGNRIRE